MSGYPSIYNLGHPAVASILEYSVAVEEKVDGSQMSFWVDETGDLQLRSKKAVINPFSPPDLFKGATATLLLLHQQSKIPPGPVFRGESVQSPKHNSLAYERVPHGNLVLFDVEEQPHQFQPPWMKRVQADFLGLEVVPSYFSGIVESRGQLEALLEARPFLGGPMIEGVVIKAYGVYGPDKKTLMAKWVRPEFVELHATEWKKSNPSKADLLEDLGKRFATPARWEKAVLHLREQGYIEDSPRDIGRLISEVRDDVAKEEVDRIKDALWSRFQREILGGATRGLPEWYKARLVDQQFKETA